jgi:protein required for attachment to host cells
MDKWAINKANETLAALKTLKKNKSSSDKDKMPIKMPIDRIHQLLQKEVLGHKIDIQVIIIHL